MLPSGDDIKRFWARTRKGEADDCWQWLGACRPYGQINICGQQVRSHVASWWLHTGARPETGVVVRHRCDNPKCVNPGHLLIGTQKDNIDDMWRRNRASLPPPNAEYKTSADQHWRKFTDREIAVAKRLLLDGKSRRLVADLTGISFQHIGQIDRGDRCAHIRPA